MQGVLPQWTHWNKYFNYQNFPTQFRLSLFQVKFVENWSNPYTLQICSKWLYSSQNQMPDFSSKRFANNLCYARRLSCLLKPQTNGTVGPPCVKDKGSRFPRKSHPLQKLFFFQYLDCSVEHWGGPHNNEQSCQRQRQRQYVQQKWKNCKMCWGARQWIDSFQFMICGNL